MKIPSYPQFVKGAFIALIAVTLGSTAAQAQAARTWVSGVGDDANPCSRTSPCATFARAITQTAVGGEVGVLDSGSFGPATITFSITLNGDGSLAGAGPGSASIGSTVPSSVIVVNGAGIVVNLRHLTIRGGGIADKGVHIQSAGTVNIEHCVITNIGGLLGDGISITQAAEVNVEHCSISGNNGVGVNIAPTALCGVTIKNTSIRKCPKGAVYAHPNSATAAGATGAAVNISKSSLNDSLFGFKAGDNVKAVLDDCVLAGNTNNGVTVNSSGTPAMVAVSRCTINDTGGFGVVASGAASSVFISNNVIFNNVTGVGALSGGVITSLGNNNINGNTTDGSPKP